jgi:hypothetical protein
MMIRAALLLTVGCAQGACSAGAPASHSVASNAANTAQAQERDQETASPMTQTRISIATERGTVTAELVDNEATRELLRLLPLTTEMRDHLRQEKTGPLPSPLPELPRQTAFSAGTLGLWGNDDFVIYYKGGRVPEPGIIVLGRVTGDLSMFNSPERTMVRIQRAD